MKRSDFYFVLSMTLTGIGLWQINPGLVFLALGGATFAKCTYEYKIEQRLAATEKQKEEPQ